MKAKKKRSLEELKMVRVEWVEGGDDDPTYLRFEGDEKN